MLSLLKKDTSTILNTNYDGSWMDYENLIRFSS